MIETPVAASPDGFARDLLVILLAASLVSIIARRIRLPSIPGYLIVGALIGGSVLGLIRSDEHVRDISDLAIVLLMFIIGLQLDTAAIRTGAVAILGVGLVSTVLVALVCWPVAMLFGLSAPAALLIALAVTMSSTAVALGLLNRYREVHRIHGRLCIGVSLVQDLLSVAVLAIIPLLTAWAGIDGAKPPPAEEAGAATGGAGLSPTLSLIQAAAMRIGIIAAMIVAGRWLLPRALQEASRNANTEALLVVASTAALAAAVVSYQLGFGPALGAFVAGFLLSATQFRHHLAGQLSPMRDLFMAVFFTAVGIKMDVVVALDAWWVLGLAVLAVVTLKSAVIGLTAWAGGATAPVALIAGVMLAQAGEFSLVILDGAADAKLIDSHVESVFIALVVATLILSTPLSILARRFQPRLARVPLARWITNPTLHDGPPPPAPAAARAEDSGEGGQPPTTIVEDPFREEPLPYPHRPVIIAGFGVVGRNLAEHFAAAGIPFVVVELNPGTVERQQKLGRRVVFGDIANPDVLESAGLSYAEAVIVTIPDDEAALRACRTIRSLAPGVFIATRTTYLSRAIAATELGADYVCVEEVVTAQDMARQVMERLARRLVERR